MSAARYNLFFAIFPDEATAVGVEFLAEKVRRDHGLTGRPLKTAHFHVSLHGLGRYAEKPQRLVEQCVRAAAQIKTSPFPVTFNRITSFKRKGKRTHPAALVSDDELEALGQLHADMFTALKLAGVTGLSKSGFTPHITLLYDEDLIPEDHPIVRPISWEVKEFALVWSHIGETRYDFLGKWTLTGACKSTRE